MPRRRPRSHQRSATFASRGGRFPSPWSDTRRGGARRHRRERERPPRDVGREHAHPDPTTAWRDHDRALSHERRPLAFDRTVSRVHCALELVASRWCGPRSRFANGTFVNGDRVWGAVPLRAGDEIRVWGPSGSSFGSTRALLPARKRSARRRPRPSPGESTRYSSRYAVPCSRATSSASLPRPRQIRDRARVTEAAVKQHLSRLYDKFGIFDQEGRRARLANEAIRRGAVSTAEILGRKPSGT
jgi:hypothetical protein